MARRRRRRRTHVGARVHDAVLDAADRLARAARARARRAELAIAFAFVGLSCVVEPWAWQGDLAPKLWAVLSGFGWAAGTVAVKYFQRDRDFDMLSFITWQMALGVLPLTLLPWLIRRRPQRSGASRRRCCSLSSASIATAGGFLAWMEVLRWLPAGTASLNMFAIPVIALLSSMAVFGERLAANEWIGIALIGVGLALITIAGAPRRRAAHRSRQSRRRSTAVELPRSSPVRMRTIIIYKADILCYADSRNASAPVPTRTTTHWNS